MESNFETYYDFGVVTVQTFDTEKCSGVSNDEQELPKLYPDQEFEFSNYLRSLEPTHKDKRTQNAEKVIIYQIQSIPKSKASEVRKKISIQRFLYKRIQRFFRNSKEIRYEARSREASKRPRVGGRFVKKGWNKFL
jgi:hypothetical protein